MVTFGSRSCICVAAHVPSQFLGAYGIIALSFTSSAHRPSPRASLRSSLSVAQQIAGPVCMLMSAAVRSHLKKSEYEIVRRTYVNVLGQQLIRDAVFVDDVVVHASACGCSSEQETEQSIRIPISPVLPFDHTMWTKGAIFTHPPRNAPTGFFTGAAVTTSCLNALLVWKLRMGACWMLRAAVRATGKRSRDAIARFNGSREL